MTAEAQVRKLLKENYPSVFSSGELQRIEFKNEDGTIATPAIIQRRLRNLEERKVIAVKYEGAKQHAHYRYLMEQERDNYIPTAERAEPHQIWKDPKKVKDLKYKTIPEYIERDGERIVRIKKVRV